MYRRHEIPLTFQIINQVYNDSHSQHQCFLHTTSLVWFDSLLLVVRDDHIFVKILVLLMSIDLVGWNVTLSNCCLEISTVSTILEPVPVLSNIHGRKRDFRKKVSSSLPCWKFRAKKISGKMHPVNGRASESQEAVIKMKNDKKHCIIASYHLTVLTNSSNFYTAAQTTRRQQSCRCFFYKIIFCQ